MSRNDVSRVDFVTNWVLPATGTSILGQLPTNAYQTIQGTFSFQSVLGLDNMSITLATAAGSTAAGTITVQCTDFGLTENDIFDPSIPWVNMNYPNTTTPISQAIASGQNTYNLQFSNSGVKWIRLLYTATSGTGNINAALSGRANSRT